MPDAGGFGLHVKVVAEGELPRQGVVVDHDGHITEHGLSFLPNRLV